MDARNLDVILKCSLAGGGGGGAKLTERSFLHYSYTSLFLDLPITTCIITYMYPTSQEQVRALK